MDTAIRGSRSSRLVSKVNEIVFEGSPLTRACAFSKSCAICIEKSNGATKKLLWKSHQDRYIEEVRREIAGYLRALRQQSIPISQETEEQLYDHNSRTCVKPKAHAVYSGIEWWRSLIHLCHLEYTFSLYIVTICILNEMNNFNCAPIARMAYFINGCCCHVEREIYINIYTRKSLKGVLAQYIYECFSIIYTFYNRFRYISLPLAALLDNCEFILSLFFRRRRRRRVYSCSPAAASNDYTF